MQDVLSVTAISANGILPDTDDCSNGSIHLQESQWAPMLKRVAAGQRNNARLWIEFRPGTGRVIESELMIPPGLIDRSLRGCILPAKKWWQGGWRRAVGPYDFPLKEVESYDDTIYCSKLRLKPESLETQSQTPGESRIVYVLTNPSFPGLVKIGRTTQGVKKRIDQLNSTGVPTSFECEYAAFVDDDVAEEKRLHDLFAQYRLRDNREFFEVDPVAVMREIMKVELGDARDT